MDFFFNPNGIAVAGAMPEPYRGGHHLLTNLTLGYKGPVYPVNPKGVLKQAKVHLADDFFEMVDIARTLERGFHLQNPPQGKARIAILSYSGASGIVTTDHMEKYGLTLARLSPKTQKRLEELSIRWITIPPWKSTGQS